MNPARGSEVRDRAVDDVQSFTECLDSGVGIGRGLVSPPVLRGDVRRAYVAAFIAELMAAEGITLKRLRAAMDDDHGR